MTVGVRCKRSQPLRATRRRKARRRTCWWPLRASPACSRPWSSACRARGRTISESSRAPAKRPTHKQSDACWGSSKVLLGPNCYNRFVLGLGARGFSPRAQSETGGHCVLGRRGGTLPAPYLRSPGSPGSRASDPSPSRVWTNSSLRPARTTNPTVRSRMAEKKILCYRCTTACCRRTMVCCRRMMASGLTCGEHSSPPDRSDVSRARPLESQWI